MVKCFLLSPRWGLSALLVALFDCFCLWGAVLTWLYDFPVVRRCMACLYEVQPVLCAHRHAPIVLRLHKLFHKLCGFSVWLGNSVDLLGQTDFFGTLLECSICRVGDPWEVECGTLLFSYLLQIFFDLVVRNLWSCNILLLQQYLSGRLRCSRDQPRWFTHFYMGFEFPREVVHWHCIALESQNEIMICLHQFYGMLTTILLEDNIMY